jgi:hypothetical protein
MQITFILNKEELMDRVNTLKQNILAYIAKNNRQQKKQLVNKV